MSVLDKEIAKIKNNPKNVSFQVLKKTFRKSWLFGYK